jgi:hypothetical protein
MLIYAGGVYTNCVVKEEMAWNNQNRQQLDINVPRLEPKDLYDRRMRRDYSRLKAYNQLLEQIYHRVYSSSQLSGNTSSILYTVPPFIIGLPKLDMEDCIVYLVFQLRQTGFQVRFTWPNLLYISWKHTESEYLTKQSPIIQAMVPEVQAPPPAPKQASQKRGKQQQAAPQPPTSNPNPFNEDVHLLTNSAPPSSFGLTPMRATPRKAADYQPPESFLQNLDRPGPQREQGQKTNNILTDLWNF